MEKIGKKERWMGRKGEKNLTTQTTSVGMGVVGGAGQPFQLLVHIRDNMYLLKRIYFGVVNSPVTPTVIG